jgi:murein DD-endopeptidase MepM/ murein hydrolase activator NlpD
MPGLNMCYGHAEGAVVKARDKVKAGDLLGHAGFANAWHVHFMVNGRTDQKGVGDRDPAPYVDFACGR